MDNGRNYGGVCYGRVIGKWSKVVVLRWNLHFLFSSLVVWLLLYVFSLELFHFLPTSEDMANAKKI